MLRIKQDVTTGRSTNMQTPAVADFQQWKLPTASTSNLLQIERKLGS